MAEKNIVTAGAYKGAKLAIRGWMTKELMLEEQKLFGGQKKPLNSHTVKDVAILDTDTTKSASSALIRGGVGVLLTGGTLGLTAALSAKNKKLHQVVITFSDSKQSLAVVDKDILTLLYNCTLNTQAVDPNFDFYEGRHNDEDDEEDEQETIVQTQPFAPSSDIAAQLQQLAALKNAGALTDEEFAKAKSRLLGGETPTQTANKQQSPRYNVILTEGTSDFTARLELIKAIRMETGLDSREAKEAVDNPPATIARGVSREKAEQIREAAESYGGEVEIKPHK